MARTLITLAKIVGGQARHARRLIKKYADDIGSSLRPAFRWVGPALLEALADGSSPAPKLKRRAAARLEQLASKLSRPARETLQGYAGILHHQLAVQAFRLKQRAKAKTELARAQRLLRAHSNTLRHNKAVVDYYTGNKEAAVKALYGARIQTPMALCNLAVHYERMGDRLKAFELFKQCDTRGVRTFPDLGQLLEMRQMLTGDRVGS